MATAQAECGLKINQAQIGGALGGSRGAGGRTKPKRALAKTLLSLVYDWRREPGSETPVHGKGRDTPPRPPTAQCYGNFQLQVSFSHASPPSPRRKM